jgi:hypothetical protein
MWKSLQISGTISVLMAKLETQINQIFLSPTESKKVSLILFEEKISTNNHLFLIAELRDVQKKTELNDLNKIAELIINSFKDKRKVAGEALFESALADINNNLAEFAHKGRKSWLGKFSALVALKSDRDFYTANTGHTSAWLRRKNTLNEVLSPEKSTVQPLKTFVNFSYGRIMNGDNMILCTTSLFNYVSLELFSKTLSGYDLTEACQRVSDILQSTARTDEGFAIFMLGMNKQEQTADKTETVEPERFSIMPEPEFSDMVNIQPEPVVGAEANNNTVQTSKPAAKKRSTKSLEGATLSTTAKSKKSDKIEPAIAAAPISVAENIYAPLPEDIHQERLGRPKFALPSIPSLPALPSWSSLKSLPAALPAFPTSKFTQLNIRWPHIPVWSNMSGPAKFFLGSFLLFAILFSMNIAAYKVRQTAAEQKNQFNQSAQALVDYLSDAESALIYKNHSQAMKFMSDAATELHKLEQLNDQESKPFQAKFDEMNNKINRVTVLRNLTPVSSLPYSISLMERAGDGYVVANSSASSFGTLTNDELSPVFMLNTIDGEVRGLAHASGAGNFVMSRDKIYLANQTAQEFQMDEYISNGDLVALKFFDPNRLHAINKSSNQVIRMTVSTNGISGVQNMLSAGVNMQSARDLAVDSDVYVLFPDSVQKFTNGQQASFNLSPISDPPANLTKIRLGNQIYLLEPVAKRVLIYNRGGELLNQVQFPELTSLTDMYVDESLREMILVNGTQIFRITF